MSKKKEVVDWRDECGSYTKGFVDVDTGEIYIKAKSDKK